MIKKFLKESVENFKFCETFLAITVAQGPVLSNLLRPYLVPYGSKLERLSLPILLAQKEGGACTIKRYTSVKSWSVCCCQSLPT